MSFGALADAYLEDMSRRLKENTMLTKKQLINKKVLSYFENKLYETSHL